MAIQFKEDLEWDFGIYLSKIQMVNSKVSGAIKRFGECIENLNQTDNTEAEIIEDLETIEIEGDIFDSLVKLGENLKNQAFHNSLLVIAYSFLEYSLVEYCKLLNKYIECNKSFIDTKGSGILKCKTFLNREFDLNVHTFKDWEDLDIARKIRNLIIHNNSNIIQDEEIGLEEQEDYDVILDIEHVDITEVGYLFIENIEYIDTIIDKSVSLIDEIISKTKGKIGL